MDGLNAIDWREDFVLGANMAFFYHIVAECLSKKQINHYTLFHRHPRPHGMKGYQLMNQ
jgi:hypothetical protein